MNLWKKIWRRWLLLMLAVTVSMCTISFAAGALGDPSEPERSIPPASPGSTRKAILPSIDSDRTSSSNWNGTTQLDRDPPPAPRFASELMPEEDIYDANLLDDVDREVVQEDTREGVEGQFLEELPTPLSTPGSSFTENTNANPATGR